MLGGMGHHKQVCSAPEGADINLVLGWWGGGSVPGGGKM